MPAKTAATLTRRTVLAGRELSYQITRSARRSVGLKIDANGLTLQLPGRFPLRELDAILQQKAEWIFDRLAAMQARQPVAVTASSQLDWLGEPRSLLLGAKRSDVGADHLQLAASAAEDIPQALARLMQREARRFLGERLQLWADRLALQPSRMQLSGAKSRWGSCTSAGAIRLNWRLMQAPIPIIDYVIIHELCHLREMNHSPRFWALVAAACPDWKVKRAWLKEHGARYFTW